MWAVVCLASIGQVPYAQAYADHVDRGSVLVALVGADWCPACVTMKRRLATQGVRYAYVNTDQKPGLASRLMVGGTIPQLIVYRGEHTQPTVNRYVGLVGTGVLRSLHQKKVRATSTTSVPFPAVGWNTASGLPPTTVARPKVLEQPRATQPVRQPYTSRYEYFRKKYGWVPAQHCGNRNCGMCNEIFGRPMKGRRTGMYTPTKLFESVVKLTQVKSGETFLDIGCGDGHLLLAVQQATGCKALGIEIDHDAGRFAQWHLGDNGRVLVGDATKIQLEADVVYMWLFPELMRKVRLPKKARRVVSYMHDIPDLNTTRVDIDGHTFYIWNKA